MNTYVRNPSTLPYGVSKKNESSSSSCLHAADSSAQLHGTAFSLLPNFALLLLCLTSPMLLHAETISGTVLDPSGAVIVGARIEISGGDLSQPIVFSSDARGKFVSPDLKPGSYSLHVTREGFEPLVKTVDLHGTAELDSSSPLPASMKKLWFRVKAALTPILIPFTGNYGLLASARLSVSTISPCIWMLEHSIFRKAR